MFSDPLKLIPFVGAVGAIVLIGMGKIDTNQALLLIAALVVTHSGISAVNNGGK
jgi:hypothetical protein